MAAVIPNEGEIHALRKDIGQVTGANNLKLGLYQNNIGTPDENTVYSGLTLATFNGYAAASLTWGTVAINGSGKAEVSASAVVFNKSSGGTSNTIYGWVLYYEDIMTGNKIRAIEPLPAPKSMAVVGDSISVTISLRDYQP